MVYIIEKKFPEDKKISIDTFLIMERWYFATVNYFHNVDCKKRYSFFGFARMANCNLHYA